MQRGRCSYSVVGECKSTFAELSPRMWLPAYVAARNNNCLQSRDVTWNQGRCCCDRLHQVFANESDADWSVNTFPIAHSSKFLPLIVEDLTKLQHFNTPPCDKSGSFLTKSVSPCIWWLTTIICRVNILSLQYIYYYLNILHHRYHMAMFHYSTQTNKVLPLHAGNRARWSNPGTRTSLRSSQFVRSKATLISEI